MADTFGTLYRNNINYSYDAANVISYDNTSSGLTSTNVQDALDELYDINNKLYTGTFDVYNVSSTGVYVAPNQDFEFSANVALANSIINSGKPFLTRAVFTQTSGSTDTKNLFCTLIYGFVGRRVPLIMNRNSPVVGFVRFQNSSTTTGKYYFQNYIFDSSKIYLTRLNIVPLSVKY